jgi:3-mercaptopyruvate sulfurtransferase SseA
VAAALRLMGVEANFLEGGIANWAEQGSVETETETKSGTSESKDAAMNAARRAIDNALNPKKRKP